MVFSNVWVGTSKNSKLHRAYHLGTDKDMRATMIESLNMKELPADTDIKEIDNQSLVTEQSYYIDMNGVGEEHYLHALKDTILKQGALNANTEMVTFKKRKSKNEFSTEYEKPRFMVYETVEHERNILLFMFINSRKYVRKATFLDFKYFSTGSTPTIIGLDSAIPIPTFITAKYDRDSGKLFVYDVLAFEKMLHLNELYQKKAEESIKQFQSGNYFIGHEKYVLTGLDESVKQKLQTNTRTIVRLAKYDNNVIQHGIRQIKEAVSQIKNKEEHVIFNDQQKCIEINGSNCMTFVGIIHNSIVKRLISGEVVVM
ncbi:hypothetical protein HB848_11210 [Listeria rocourtiae]|uniref:hypothetical protein n=1 Tax=Listeria rocourtiae TaxID=647910 RepID=UPI00162ABBD0|nr:hypothetical protein [Listeria rocourtiae]MBC1435906.1 hypothetical protein [Listeria rocourtiae]